MIKKFIGLLIVLAIGFTGGAMAPRPALQHVAYETSPGPSGSGVLGNWSGLSHGLYCFQPGSTPDTSYTRAARATNPISSAAMACKGEDVRIYGDSITSGGKYALAAEFNKLGYTVFVDAWSGRPTTQAVDALVRETALPLRVIMATGTNDIFNPKVMGAQVQRAKNFVAAYNIKHGTKVQLFWVDVQIARWKQSMTVQRNDQRNAMAINLEIYKRIPSTNVVPWTNRFMMYPTLLTTYLADGVHPKPGAGYAYWAAIIRGWMQSFGGM